jgi:hypothetical protein
LIIKGDHLNESGRQEIRQIKLNMNRNRTQFNWDHLDKISV